MAGLDPRLSTSSGVTKKGVDARIKSGHDDSGLLNRRMLITDAAQQDSRGSSLGTLGRVVTAGVVEIGFVARHGRTRLSHLYQHDPLRVLFPDAASGEPPVAVLLTTSGGLVGGDRLAISIDVGADALAHVTAQAAEKVYRSAGPDTSPDIALRVGAG